MGASDSPWCWEQWTLGWGGGDCSKPPTSLFAALLKSGPIWSHIAVFFKRSWKSRFARGVSWFFKVDNFLNWSVAVYNVVFLVYNKAIWLYTHIHTLFQILLHYDITRYWTWFPILYSRPLFICFICRENVKVLVAQSCATLCDPMDWSLPNSSVHGNSPGKKTTLDSYFLLQGIVLFQGLNLGLLHCRQTLYYMTTREAVCIC